MQCSEEMRLDEKEKKGDPKLAHQLSSPDEILESDDDSEDEVKEELLLSPLHKLYDWK